MSTFPFNLPMNVHNIQKQNIRNRPDKYAESPLAQRFRFEVSEGIRPAEYFQAHRYLPVMQKDVTTEDYIVIPKGRICSSATTEDTSPSGLIIYPSGAGSIYTFKSAIDDAYTTSTIDGSYFGYDDYISNILLPCNGGSLAQIYYSSYDVTAGTLSASGNYASDGTEFYYPANYPIGVAYHDWYQDLAGRYLNYRMWPDGGHVLTRWYVEVPYVKVTDGGYTTASSLGSGVTPKPTTGSVSDWASKYAINKRFTYLTVNLDTDTFKPGALIKSDIIGNYCYEGVANRSASTVGKLIGIDNRFPKSGLDDVQTYPGSSMPGTQTAGLPKFLFDFVVECQKLTGTTPHLDDVIGYVRAGFYGVARILVNI